MPPQDIAIIGGGFYGAALAVYLAKQQRFGKVSLFEQEPVLLSRASFANQARVHNGCHYPRSFTTAQRSRQNFPRFVAEYQAAVYQDFQQIYAIARHNSKVSVGQFTRFCQEIGVSLKPVDAAVGKLFNEKLIAAAFTTDEYAFNSERLAEILRDDLKKSGVTVHLQTRVTEVRHDGQGLRLVFSTSGKAPESLVAARVLNCTYSGLNSLHGDAPKTKTLLKHEIAEMALVEVPAPLRNLGITVMDGPFFSLMPFPARQRHTLSHVRYTPHTHWADTPGLNPYDALTDHSQQTRFDRMRRDAARYVPIVSQVEYSSSLLEVKTVLSKSENDDARPILFEGYVELPGYYAILGGKIDNIYDVMESLEQELHYAQTR